MERKKEAQLLQRESNEDSGEDDEEGKEVAAENGTSFRLKEGVEEGGDLLESDTESVSDMSDHGDGEVS